MSSLPQQLQQCVDQHWEAYLASCDAKAVNLLDDAEFLSTMPHVWGCSDFVAKACIQSPDIIADLFQSGDINKQYADSVYLDYATHDLNDIANIASLASILRKRRMREMVRIAWRDLAGWATLAETLSELSDFADACINKTLDKLYEFQREKWGTPYNTLGEQQYLQTIAVGKLGGQELNFSSDIDLIFCFPSRGETRDGSISISNEQFFVKLVQSFVKVFNDITNEGFVFRVDLRLRPYGDSGPLVATHTGMEAYYQEQGRVWERYALLKSRIVTDNKPYRKPLQNMIKRFVYRRYLDYSVIEALRDLKTMIDQETRQKGLQGNIKRGYGGIREVEFIVQALQLIRGGKETHLQHRQLLPSLRLLKKSGMLEKDVITGLEAAYCFFRNVENRLQMISDQQVQSLPEDEFNKIRLAEAMHYDHWDELAEDIEAHRIFVRSHFVSMMREPKHQADVEEANDEFFALQAVWSNHYGADSVIELFDKLGCQVDPQAIINQLHIFREGSRVRGIDSLARKRLDNLMPLLLIDIFKTDNPEEVLARIITLLGAIVRRSAYIVLLLENPGALSRLVSLCGASSWIAEELGRYPLLLDELLQANMLSTVAHEGQTEREIQLRLLAIPIDDLEEQMECLRQIKHAQVLRIAMSDIVNQESVDTVSDNLSDLAALVLRQVLQIAWHHLILKHGVPTSLDEALDLDSFAIVAYGKLGSYELSYSSDLDLVFLYEGDGSASTNGSEVISNAQFYSKLAQKIMHLLSVRTAMGSLYELDVRLRPSGASGPLVSSMEAFRGYQHEKAWTWEHQALIRARVVVGSQAFSEKFNNARQTVLSRERGEEDLKKQIVRMRARMKEQFASKKGDSFDIKQGAGGMTDVEFMVQYGVLRWAYNCPALLVSARTSYLLETMGCAGKLSAAVELTEAYRLYREKVHKASLQNAPARVTQEECAAHRDTVRAVWAELFGEIDDRQKTGQYSAPV